MPEAAPTNGSTTEGLAISPSLEPSLLAAQVSVRQTLIDRRTLYISALAILVSLVAAAAAKALVCLIAFITNLVFYGRISWITVDPAGNHLGKWVILIPVAGGIIVGLMARFGSSGIRGHGIPEAMERVLEHQSKIPARLTFLKPLSAAIAIGTGGPFGAEGPIIATGGALGSLAGQLLETTPQERKTLLAAGAAAGMAATFGTPVSALLLAIELLLFEFRPRSFIPVALAAAVAAAIRFMLHLPYPVFPSAEPSPSPISLLVIYGFLGALVGLVSVIATRAVYAIEDFFDHLPIHWMWWPALGAIPVGIIGIFQPHTLGVGYDNIGFELTGQLTVAAAVSLCIWKFVSWSIALGSGTSGGTLAPLLTIGGALGLALGALARSIFPHAGISLETAALVGMASMFAGASRAMLASIVFALEATLRPLGMLPVLGGCSAAFLVSCLLMRNTIMTEKIARRGVRAPAEYDADPLAQIPVSAAATTSVVSLQGDDPLASVLPLIQSRDGLWSHQGYPVVDKTGSILGVLTLRDLLDPSADPSVPLRKLLKRPPIVVHSDATLREAADHMVRHEIGRLPVVDKIMPYIVIGIITRSDILEYNQRIGRKSATN
jgi:chloride channel protein, CIC family